MLLLLHLLPLLNFSNILEIILTQEIFLTLSIEPKPNETYES